MSQGKNLKPIGDIVCTNKDVFLILGWWIYWAYKIKTSFFKGFYGYLWVQWHFIIACGATHTLALIPMVNMALTILVDCRRIVSNSDNILCSPLRNKVSSTWFCLTCMKYIEYIILGYTSPHYISNASVKDKTIDPSVLSTKANQLLTFPQREVGWKLAGDQVVGNISQPWILCWDRKDMLI